MKILGQAFRKMVQIQAGLVIKIKIIRQAVQSVNHM
jgi:hypothetical protein